MATSTLPERDLLFVKLAMAREALPRTEAKRVLAQAKRDGTPASALAERLGLVSRSARLRVERRVDRHLQKGSGSDAAKKVSSGSDVRSKSDAKKVSSGSDVRARSGSDVRPKSGSDVREGSDVASSRSDVARQGKRRKARTPGKAHRVRSDARLASRRRGGGTLPLAAAALLGGALLGAAVLAFVNKDAGAALDQAQVPPAATPEPTEAPTPAVTRVREPAAPVDDAERTKARGFALRSAGRLEEAAKEKAALAMLDDYLARYGADPKVSEARSALLARCRELVTKSRARVLRLARAGDREGAAGVLATLRSRLPESVQGDVLALAIELEGVKPGAAPAAPEVASAPPPAPAPAAPAPAASAEEPVEAPEEPAVPEEPAPEEPAAEEPEEPQLAGPVAPTPAERPEEESDGPVSEDPEVLVDMDPGREIDKTSPLALALSDTLAVPFTFRKNGTIEIQYSMVDALVAEDFEARGFDKFQAGHMDGFHAVSRTGLEMGVGSQSMAKTLHALTLCEEYTIELEAWFNYSSGRTTMVVLFGDDLGASFGQALVKVSKSGRVRPITGRLDRGVFREERLVKIKIQAKDGKVTISCNGRVTAEKEVGEKKLTGRFGILGADVRLQITALSIRGKVDPTSL